MFERLIGETVSAVSLVGERRLRTGKQSVYEIKTLSGMTLRAKILADPQGVGLVLIPPRKPKG